MSVGWGVAVEVELDEVEDDVVVDDGTNTVVEGDGVEPV